MLSGSIGLRAGLFRALRWVALTMTLRESDVDPKGWVILACQQTAALLCEALRIGNANLRTASHTGRVADLVRVACDKPY